MLRGGRLRVVCGRRVGLVRWVFKAAGAVCWAAKSGLVNVSDSMFGVLEEKREADSGRRWPIHRRRLRFSKFIITCHHPFHLFQ